MEQFRTREEQEKDRDRCPLIHIYVAQLKQVDKCTPETLLIDLATSFTMRKLPIVQEKSNRSEFKHPKAPNRSSEIKCSIKKCYF